MRVIRAGLRRLPTWPIGAMIGCNRCDGFYQIEEGDAMHHSGNFYYLPCPNCDHEMLIEAHRPDPDPRRQEPVPAAK